MALQKQLQREIACCGFFFLNNHIALWHERNSHNVKCLLNELFISLVIIGKKTTCTVGLMKNNGEAHLFLQELLE